MSKKLVKEATQFRNEIPELEGLLVGKLDGTKLWGDTLKELNHENILSSASIVVRAVEKLRKFIEKKDIRIIDTEIDDGYITIFVTDKAIIVAFYGDDAKSQLGIIKINLRKFVQKIVKLI